ncbi:MAG: (d)CMP kinase [Lachnospiraceae bacterium]|nr:(d)CMP kinase [Lachnospiraceae bacterium]
MKIAIDGPAGAGKSTIARRVAASLGYIYVDTGAMYRAMALYLLRCGVAADDAGSQAKACRSADISIRFEGGEQQVILNGENVSALIRSEEVSRMASVSSANPVIREKLVSLQRKLADETSVVMDGRDIGTVVLPDAELKIYLTASARVRAERRFKEMAEKGALDGKTLEEIEASIIERDERDMTRETSPLRRADDAHLVDSSAMTIEEVTAAILELIHG